MAGSGARRNFAPLIWILTAVIYAVVALLAYLPGLTLPGLSDANLRVLPMVNAILNSFTTLFLAGAYAAVRRREIQTHRRLIYGAFASTTLFLLTYVAYHALTTSARFGGLGWVRPVYFFILLTHVVLAVVIVPMALFSAAYGLTDQRGPHRRIARWTMPVWLYVSVTGVVVYLMMRPYY